jgi:hypothetical protein
MRASPTCRIAHWMLGRPSHLCLSQGDFCLQFAGLAEEAMMNMLKRRHYIFIVRRAHGVTYG